MELGRGARWGGGLPSMQQQHTSKVCVARVDVWNAACSNWCPRDVARKIINEQVYTVYILGGDWAPNNKAPHSRAYQIYGRTTLCTGRSRLVCLCPAHMSAPLGAVLDSWMPLRTLESVLTSASTASALLGRGCSAIQSRCEPSHTRSRTFSQSWSSPFCR